MMIIRHALISDVPKLVDMSYRFYPLTDYPKFAEFDWDTITELTLQIVQHGIYLVAEVDGELHGMLALVLIPFTFNKHITIASEVVWWVNPEMQKSGIGTAMIKYADNLRKLRGARAFHMVRLSTSPKILDDVYSSMGFRSSEFCFTKVT